MVIGIDPGITGAIAVLGRNLTVIDIPTIQDGKKKIVDCQGLINIISMYGLTYDDSVYMEKVHAMPGQGVTSMFNFGRTVGRIEGVFEDLLDSADYVSPQAWKKFHGLLKQPKSAAVELVRLKYPDRKWLISKDGRADAALIAEYGRYLETKKAEG